MKSLKRKSIATQIMPLIGNENLKSVLTFLSQIKKGKRALPLEWETHLLAILECDKKELKNKWPEVRFHSEKSQKEEIRLIIGINIQKADISITRHDFFKLISAAKVFNSLGFSIEVKIQSIE